MEYGVTDVEAKDLMLSQMQLGSQGLLHTIEDFSFKQDYI